MNLLRGIVLAIGVALSVSSACVPVTRPASDGARESRAAVLGGTESGFPDGLANVPSLRAFTRDARALRLQILVSTWSEDGGLLREGFRVDAEYFYPASAVKLAVAVASLEKLEHLRRASGCPSVSDDAPLRIFADGGRVQDRDSSNLDGGRITIGHEIRKALIVSNNESFNRLFAFVGYDELESSLRARGFDSLRLRHFVGVEGGDARLGSRLQLMPANCSPVELPLRPATSLSPPSDIGGLLVGEAHYDEKGRFQPEPMSFEAKNRASLRDLQDLLMSVVRPEWLPERALQLSSADRAFLVGVLSTLPSESKNPTFDRKSQPDELHRPLLMAARRALPHHDIRSWGKGGQAYGFVVQNSYLVDETTGKSVFVAATVHANSNGTVNDDHYEYSEVARPFIDALGEFVAANYLR